MTDIARLSEFIYRKIDMTKPLMQLSVDLALAIDQEFGHYPKCTDPSPYTCQFAVYRNASGKS